MDFPEEGLEPLSDKEYYDGLVSIKEKIEKLYATSMKGRIIKDSYCHRFGIVLFINSFILSHNYYF